MDRGPLPPHERSWRHPSELGPTRFDVESADHPTSSHLVALAGGAMAVLAVAVLVVAMTPRESSGPMALSATTTPITVRAGIASPAAATAPATWASPLLVLRSTSATLLKSFTAFPHAVTSGPQFDLDGTAIADAAPDDDDMVFVRTEAVTYEMQWDDAQMITAPEGSVIFDSDGDLVAHVAGGDLVSLVDD